MYEDIVKNKKYRSLDPSLVKEAIADYFKRNPSHTKFLERKRSKKYKEIVKKIRGELHKAYGSFQDDKSKRDSFLKAKNYDAVLNTSVSAKERLPFYTQLYKDIFSLTGEPKIILDLGAGLNPVSYSYMGLSSVTYYSYDINTDDVDFLNRFFKIANVDGKASILNLRKMSLVKKLPSADVCFMFKVLDPLEKKGHTLSERIIMSVPAKYIIVSFATKTLSGNKMKHPYRGWIERMLERIGYSYKKILTENEVYYVIEKMD